MKAVILAAGRGTRIETVTHGMPKCLLDFGGRTILDCQIEGLLAAGVSEIGIVIGHNGYQIVDHLARTFSNCFDSFRFIHNPLFATTNNIYSLWLAGDWIGLDSFLCLNADVLCHPAVLLPAVSGKAPVSMIVDPQWRDETMKVVIRNQSVVQMSKSISRAEYSATYIGITAFSRQVTPLLFHEIGRMLGEGQVDQFFNAAVQRLVDRGLHVGFVRTRGLPWAEIDDPADLQFARSFVFPRLTRSCFPSRGERTEVPAVA
ncbi:MAG: NTP transferase domain-containing protein [Acidobacteriota bacterium]